MTAAHIRRRRSRDEAAARRARIEVFLARILDGRDLTLPERQQLADDVRATQAAAAHSREMARKHQQAADRTRKAADAAVREIEDDRDAWRKRAEQADYALAPPPDDAEHAARGTNAEDCPACRAAPEPPPYPFICPGPAEQTTIRDARRYGPPPTR